MAKRYFGFVLIGIVAVALYIVQIYNYLLFHTLAEIFSIVIAFTIFIVAWNGRSYSGNSYLLLLGVAYLFIGFLDTLHTLGYHGMGVFTDYGYYANQVWIATRFVEAITLTVAFSRPENEIRIRAEWLMVIYTLVSAVVIVSIFFTDIFPPCFIEGVGQTRFKVVAEYVINGILLVALLLLYRKRRSLAPAMFRLMVWSIVFTILSELAFTFYVHNYGISNMIGHYCKVASFYLIYLAVTRTYISEPYNSIFRELTEMNEVNERIFAIISHDLRSPFGALSYLASSLRDEFETYGKEELKTVIAEMAGSIEYVYSLTENLLHWAYYEKQHGRITIGPVDVPVIITQAVAAMRPVARQKDITFHVEGAEDAVWAADQDSMLIVMRNVISNAVKFSHPGSTVELVTTTTGDRVTLTVKDHGVGMESTDVPAGAEIRSTRGTAGEKGTGLGLQLVRRYVRENKGTVSIVSAPGEGTSVTISLPAYSG